MSAEPQVNALLDDLREDVAFRQNVTAWRTIEATDGVYAPFPPDLHPDLARTLRVRGIERLYSHQAEAFERAKSGESFVVVTPTASGKTLCYNLPVLDAVLNDPSARALYLFPTKALSQDQLSELHEVVEKSGSDVKTFTYDGDTDIAARRSIRQLGHIVITNPDMLHKGILPNHAKWYQLFQYLRFIVIDELHNYRGVFGSHMANVMARLRRICDFYGAKPQVICCSATIRNPEELAERVTGTPMKLIDRSGAPTGRRHFILYNPPVVNRQLGVRKDAMLEATTLAERFLKRDVSFILFARSRMATEVLLTYLREAACRLKIPADRIAGYRGGYLPKERRAIEKGLRDGAIRAVVATNALELGIDIGSLDAAILCGYPGSIASTWQQAGRAGRRRGDSIAVCVASSSLLDQFMVTHPDYTFGQPPESGLVNPENRDIYVAHLKCAAFELPFDEREGFTAGVASPALAEPAAVGARSTVVRQPSKPAGRSFTEWLTELEKEQVLHRSGKRWHWSTDSFPAEKVGLRSVNPENFVIVDVTDPQTNVVGEVDAHSAPSLIHEGAIYLHLGQQFHVEKLDWKEKKAYVKRVNVEHFTDAEEDLDVRVLERFREDSTRTPVRSFGELVVTLQTVGYKKIRLHTHENLGYGEVHTPAEDMHTAGYWLTFTDAERLFAPTPRPEWEDGLRGLAHVLQNIAPVFLLCEPRDLRTYLEVKSEETLHPTVFLYDNHPGGIGLAEKLYDLHASLLQLAGDVIRNCPCERGCPSCVGPVVALSHRAKPAALGILSRISG